MNQFPWNCFFTGTACFYIKEEAVLYHPGHKSLRIFQKNGVSYEAERLWTDHSSVSSSNNGASSTTQIMLLTALDVEQLVWNLY